MIGSTLTVGFGGSVGVEAPVVLTGAAIGSNLARILKLDYKSVTLMIACGSAAAIAGIFKAPIAGIFSRLFSLSDYTLIKCNIFYICYLFSFDCCPFSFDRWSYCRIFGRIKEKRATRNL
jgi:hypothetical protein